MSDPAPPETNLASLGQNFRLRMGVLVLGASLVASVIIVKADVHRGWRAALFVPFFMAAFGAWQGLYRVCPDLAFRGVREDRTGAEDPIGRPQERASVRCIARRVLLISTLTAGLLTAVLIAVP